MLNTSLDQKIFIGIEVCLFILFMWMDLLGKELGAYSNKVKYISILLCFLYIIFIVRTEEYSLQTRGEVFKLKVALGFTLLSDTFLLLTSYESLGVTTFLMVQIVYWYRLHEGIYCNFRKQLFVVGLVMIGLYLLQVNVDYLLCVSVLYYILIVFNVVYAVVYSQNRLFKIGLVLFLLCDTNVALYNVATYVSLPIGIYYVIFFLSSKLMWFFYLPSQVCIVLSHKKAMT